MDNKDIKLTKRELELMQIIWNTEDAVLATDLLKICESRDLNISIYLVHNLLRSLLTKGLIAVSSYELVGKTHSRKYEATISEREFELLKASKFFEDSKNLDVNSLVASLLDTKESDIDTLSELESMIAKRKEELQEK